MRLRQKQLTNLRILIALLIAMAFFNACSDPDDEPETTLSATAYMPMTTGSWWVYVVTKRDSVTGGGDIFIGRDTLRVTGTFDANGHSYAQLEGSMGVLSSGNQLFGLRDSSGFLVNEQGIIVLPELNNTDTLNESYYAGLQRFYILTEDDVPTVVPAGTYETVNFQGVVFREPVGLCPDSIGLLNNQFAYGIGLVRATYWYSATGACVYFERALESYHLE